MDHGWHIPENDLTRFDLKKRCESDPWDYYNLIKVMIAGAAYPNYYCLKEAHEESEVRNMKNFNPLSTIYFKGVPKHENYKYAKPLIEIMKKCGPIKSVYCEDTRIFIEFDAERSTLQCYRSYFSDNKYKYDGLFQQTRLSAEGNEVIPAVKLALKLSRRNNSEAGLIQVCSSEGFLSILYLIN